MKFHWHNKTRGLKLKKLMEKQKMDKKEVNFKQLIEGSYFL